MGGVEQFHEKPKKEKLEIIEKMKKINYFINNFKHANIINIIL